MIQDSPVQDGDEESLRKERIRLAQRTYRNRKDMKFASVKERADRLERALEQTMKSFTKFQDIAMMADGLPPKVVLALSKAAIEIASHSQEVRLDGGKKDIDHANAVASPAENLLEEREVSQLRGNSEEPSSPLNEQGASSNHDFSDSGSAPGSDISILPRSAVHTRYTTSLMNRFDTNICPQPSSPLFPWTSSLHNITLAQRLRFSCIERGLQLLSLPSATVATLHPSLSLHLFSYPQISIPHLRTLAESTLLGLSLSQTHYGPPPVKLTPTNLKMFRSVEGNSVNVMERPNSMDVQRLVFGKTRTRVKTGLSGYEGDWLEPEDVEEYLEDKGLFFGTKEGTIEMVVPQETLREMKVELSGPLPAVESSWTSDFTPQYPAQTLLQSSTPAVVDDISVAAQDVFNAESWNNFDASNAASIPPQLNTNQFWVASEATSAFITTTLNVHNLIETLALSAVCIGPGPGNRRGDIDNALKMSIAGF